LEVVYSGTSVSRFINASNLQKMYTTIMDVVWLRVWKV